MTRSNWLKLAEAKLKAAGITSARLDAELLLSRALEISRENLLAHSEIELESQDLARVNDWLELRLKRQPISQITGQAWFYGLEFIVTPDVLTPRPETEAMVELAVKLAPEGGRLIDVGTGCGAIAIAIAKGRPDLKVTASDISAEALGVARHNAKRHKVNLELVQSNMLAGISGRFDAATANLPYLTNDAELLPEVRHEPPVALLGGPDGLELYRRLFEQLPAHISPSAIALTESDPWQQESVKALAAAAGFKTTHETYFILAFSANSRNN